MGEDEQIANVHSIGPDRVGGSATLITQVDDEAIERSIAEINEAIRRTSAAKKA